MGVLGLSWRPAGRAGARLGPIVGVALAVAANLLCAGAVAKDSRLEYAVKANYLYKLAPFVTWPASGAPAAGAPFSICVVGVDPFGDLLDDAVRGQTIDGRTIQVRRLALATPAMGCQIAFLGGSPTQTVAAAIHLLRGQPVLTVTNGAAAGVIDFVIVAGRVRFRIDDDAAAHDGLVISSKLLSLAVSVKPKAAGAGP